MATTTEKIYLNQKQISESYGIARQTVAGWTKIENPIPWLPGRGYPMPEAGIWITENFINPLRQNNEAQDFNFHKTRKMKSEADMAERANMLEAQSVIKLDYVEDELREFVTRLKETLRVIPLKYAEDIAMRATSVAETKKALREAIDKSLNEVNLNLIYQEQEPEEIDINNE